MPAASVGGGGSVPTGEEEGLRTGAGGVSIAVLGGGRAKGKRVRGAEVGEGRAEKRRWERRELGIGRGAENSGELPDEDHQAQRRDQSYCPVRTE